MERECLFYNKLDNEKVQCVLCHHKCTISNNKIGICGVRKNIKGILYAMTFGKFCSVSNDPIEKKPLYHFYPGKSILSFGSIGCNLKCIFCQNYEISQKSIEDYLFDTLSSIDANQIIELCKKSKSDLVAFTYNEPIIMYEYLIDAVPKLKEKNIKTVLVTNGAINPEAAESLSKIVDAANIDLKAFTDEFYKKYCKGSLDYVKKFIEIFYNNKVHIELTNLVVTSLNDDMPEIIKMIEWIECINKNIPVHFSKYHPMYLADMKSTDEEFLKEIYIEARKKLNYVYIGNIGDEEYNSTICPNCNEKVIIRRYYNIRNKLKNGNCPNCNSKISGRF